ncbi:MAG: hypothetical protein ABI222_16885 [Opitutaceae bacterium]
MPRRLRSIWLATSLLGFLAGCATTSDTPAADIYEAPPPGAPAAYVLGSRINKGGLFGDEYTGFVVMIDLKVVDNAKDRWDKPLALAPGKHTLFGEFRYSNFMARASIPLEVKAGTTYQLMIKYTAAAAPETQRFNDFWIIDKATGKPVTKVYRQQATGGKTGTIFNVTY